MAIIYSYPETLELLPADMLIGTSTIRVAGKKKNITKNFTLELLKSFILDGNTGVQWGTITGTLSNQTDLQAALNTKQGNITLTTTGSSGAATFVGNILNIPNYSTSGGYVPYVGATQDIILGTQSLFLGGRDEIILSPTGLEVYDTLPGASTGAIITSTNVSVYDYTGGDFTAMSSGGITFPDLSFQSTAFPPTGGTISEYIRGDGTLATFPTVGTWGTLNYPTWTTGTPFVKMTAVGTFALDTNTYLTSAVTSVGMTVPSAFSVTPSTITSSGTFAITGAGLTSQYVRGDGTLANFPTSTGGGSSFNYYLNGSISQGTFGGTPYYQMSRTPVFGAGTNFTRTNGAGNGYIASFITDAGDPNQLNIPGGNWNVEFWFNASSGGGTPSFYAELYKVDATNVFTLIASDSLNPEGITNGTVVDQYFTSIPVPQTALLTTDRLAVRIFVNTSGKTITLHTENSNLSEVLTTFSSGLTALNGLTQQLQYFAVGTTGSDFNISSTTNTHTFNLPNASAINRGALSSTDWSTFNAKQDALVSGTNIKTINGNTILGSGDLLVKGVHALVKPSVGGSVSVSVTSTALSAQAQTANRLIVSPFIPSQTITCASLYINVATLVAGSNAQILIYSNLNGKPDTKIYQSANLDCSTTGNKIATTTQTFEAGNTYWIGVHTSATQSLTVISTANLLPIFTTSTTQVSSFFITTTFGSAPTTFGTPSNNSATMPYVGITI